MKVTIEWIVTPRSVVDVWTADVSEEPVAVRVDESLN
jgi:hypothetical protein